MILYPILQGYVNVLLKLPTLLVGVIIVGLLILGFIGLSEIRNAIFAILTAPIGLFLICYLAKVAGELHLVIMIASIIIRLAVDISIIFFGIMIVRYFKVGKVKK